MIGNAGILPAVRRLHCSLRFGLYPRSPCDHDQSPPGWRHYKHRSFNNRSPDNKSMERERHDSDNTVLYANHTVSHPVTSVPGFCNKSVERQ